MAKAVDGILLKSNFLERSPCQVKFVCSVLAPSCGGRTKLFEDWIGYIWFPRRTFLLRCDAKACRIPHYRAASPVPPVKMGSV
jgi:hypothetical protein